MTPEDIEQKLFTVKRVSKGYDPDEVDDFLDAVAEAYRQMQDKVYAAEAKADRYRRELDGARNESVKQEAFPEPVNDAVRLLNAAQETYDRIKHEAAEAAVDIRAAAQQEATEIVAAGHEKRHVIIGQLEEKREALQEHVTALQATVNAVRNNMKLALEAIGES